MLAHRAGVTVVADAAHGAHFGLHAELPEAALNAGADIAVLGFHKLMGSFTQTAVLHVRREFPRERLEAALKMLQSTSPSFPLLCSLDVARQQLVDKPELWAHTVALAGKVRRQLKTLSGLACLGGEVRSFPGVAGYDPTKILLTARGLSGYDLAERLRRQGRIQVELATADYVLLVMTPGDNEETTTRLNSVLAALDRGLGLLPEKQRIFCSPLPDPEVVLTPRDAFWAASRAIPLGEAVNQVAAEIIAPYPPGIPVVCPGERFSPEIIDLLFYLRQLGHFHGPADPSLDTVRVIDEQP
jgi:arginine decarboxylase